MKPFRATTLFIKPEQFGMISLHIAEMAKVAEQKLFTSS
jgi:hypothetical protein